jgi:hypothetical protein
LLKETMNRIFCYCSLATLLACGACSSPAVNPYENSTTPPSEEARAIYGLFPAPPALNPEMKPEYSDKATFLAELESTRPKQEVELDGKNVWKGFGPTMRYHTNGNGSISR